MLFFFVIAYVVGTHLNSIDRSMQFKWIPQICLYKEVDKKYTSCNLKTTESNMVYYKVIALILVNIISRWDIKGREFPNGL